MSALTTAFVVFACCASSALAGMVLCIKVPDHHLDDDSKDVVKLVLGLVATMVALVLGLLIASANSSFNTQSTELRELTANAMQLDHALALYGPETREARDTFRQLVTAMHQRIWPADGSSTIAPDPSLSRDQVDAFYQQLKSLVPKTEAQRGAQTTALDLGRALAQTRLLMFEQLDGSTSWPLLVVLVFWVSVLFLGFGLLAPLHTTNAVVLTIGALSVAGAIFLILELSQPYVGLIHVSDASVRNLLAGMGR